MFECDGCRQAVSEQPCTDTNFTATPVRFLANIITVYTKSDMLTCVKDLRIMYLCLTGPLDELGQG